MHLPVTEWMPVLTEFSVTYLIHRVHLSIKIVHSESRSSLREQHIGNVTACQTQEHLTSHHDWCTYTYAELWLWHGWVHTKGDIGLKGYWFVCIYYDMYLGCHLIMKYISLSQISTATKNISNKGLPTCTAVTDTGQNMDPPKNELQHT